MWFRIVLNYVECPNAAYVQILKGEACDIRHAYKNGKGNSN